MIPDIVLFPHCDLHLALANPLTQTLTLRVMLRTRNAILAFPYDLEDVTNQCEVDFFAPHLTAGHRFDHLPFFNPALGVVSATHTGVYLFQVRFTDSGGSHHYQVGRLQVHADVVGWWFGNDSITTALDTVTAHAQPSIYAKFSADPTGADLIGDITGHDYVTLTSADPTRVEVVSPDGRLRGLLETSAGVDLTGSFLGHTQTIKAYVEHYGKTRSDLFTVRAADVANFAEMHNIIFIGDGFRDTTADKDLFDEMVTKTADEIFTKPRHQPYPMLVGSFNTFKAYAPSRQHTATCGFRVMDEKAGKVAAGFPIPYNGRVGGEGTYTPEELVRRVGLPMRGETRDASALVPEWNGKSLPNFTSAKVDGDLVDAWRGQQSVGILTARDTYFGLMLGRRPADRISGQDGAPVLPPGGATPDSSSPQLSAFIGRLYAFYNFANTRACTPDPRRHPPELYAGRGEANPGISIMRYIAGLQYHYAPYHPIGGVWEPDPATFKPSRGLVALLVNDGVTGGSNINDQSITAQTLAKADAVAFDYANPADKREMHRSPPPATDADVDEVINTVAHEFGHSFNLDDEYEDFGGDEPGQIPGAFDFIADNITRLPHVRFGPAPSRLIDPDLVKWLELLRMSESATLLAHSVAEPDSIVVRIDGRFMAAWQALKAAGAEVSLRRRVLSPTGQQLPLVFDDAHYLTKLTILHIEEEAGELALGGPELPAPPFATFEKGSVVFVPRRDKAGQLQYVAESAVLKYLHDNHLPVNQDTDTANANKDADSPVSISGFKAPCKSYKLIGVYEGGNAWAGGYYRPSGLCKMRTSSDVGTGDGEFCHVCKWLIVNRIDPGLHALLDKLYYPEAKKNG